MMKKYQWGTRIIFNKRKNIQKQLHFCKMSIVNGEHKTMEMRVQIENIIQVMINQPRKRDLSQMKNLLIEINKKITSLNFNHHPNNNHHQMEKMLKLMISFSNLISKVNKLNKDQKEDKVNHDNKKYKNKQHWTIFSLKNSKNNQKRKNDIQPYNNNKLNNQFKINRLTNIQKVQRVQKFIVFVKAEFNLISQQDVKVVKKNVQMVVGYIRNAQQN